MSDDRKHGCTLIVGLEFAKMGMKLRIIIQLLSRAGLSEEYKNKILAIKFDQASTNITIRFDSTANCFEAMQQITHNTLRFSPDGFIEPRCMSCPCGRFVKVTIFADLDNLEFEPITKDFERYGQILIAERVKIDGVCTGNIELVMFVKPGSILYDNKLQKFKKDKIKVEQYFPSPDGKSRVSKETVDDLWNKHGYFSRMPNVDKLTIGDRDQAKTIDQVD